MNKTVKELRELTGTSSTAIINAMELFNEAFLYSDDWIKHKSIQEHIFEPLEKGSDLEVENIIIRQELLNYNLKFNYKNQRKNTEMKTHNLNITYKFADYVTPQIFYLEMLIDRFGKVYRRCVFDNIKGRVSIVKYFKGSEYEGRDMVEKVFYNNEGGK